MRMDQIDFAQLAQQAARFGLDPNDPATLTALVQTVGNIGGYGNPYQDAAQKVAHVRQQETAMKALEGSGLTGDFYLGELNKIAHMRPPQPKPDPAPPVDITTVNDPRELYKLHYEGQYQPGRYDDTDQEAWRRIQAAGYEPDGFESDQIQHNAPSPEAYLQSVDAAIAARQKSEIANTNDPRRLYEIHRQQEAQARAAAEAAQQQGQGGE